MSLLDSKKDRYNQDIFPGDICARSKNDKIELIIYRKEVFGGKGSKGEFGRFEGLDGATTVKYSSVVFICDPMGKRKNKSDATIALTKKYYEGQLRD